MEESREIINTVFNKPAIFAIIEKSTSEIIGCVGFDYDKNHCKSEDEALLGYWLGEEYWGRGFMTEAVREVVRFAREDCRLKGLWCGNYIENTASANVQKKCGFVFDHTETESCMPAGEGPDDNRSGGEMKSTDIRYLKL